MAPNHPTNRLWKTLGWGWLSFALLGLGLRYGIQGPDVTVIIDQSYCPSDHWQSFVVHPYKALYQKHQTNQLSIAQIVIVTNMGQSILSDIPSPDQLGRPFGQPSSPATLIAVQQKFLETRVLQCPQSR